jgi:hypothetical protein
MLDRSDERLIDCPCAEEWLMLPGDFFFSTHPVVGGRSDTLFFPTKKMSKNVPSNSEIIIEVKKAQGDKCERCWNYSTKVGKFLHRPTLCERCVSVIDDGILAGLIAIDEEGYFWTDMRSFDDEAHLPMTEHIDYWVKQFGEQYRSELEKTTKNPQ